VESGQASARESSEKYVALFVSNFVANTTLIWLTILFYNVNRFYVNFLSQEVHSILIAISVVFTVGQIPVLVRGSKRGDFSSGYLLFRVLARFLLDALGKLSPEERAQGVVRPNEKVAVLFIIVKAFFVPTMLQFAFFNWTAVVAGWSHVFDSPISMRAFNQHGWPFMLALIYTIFTLIYCFGYLVQADFLNNKIKSVEPTVMGWACTVICYPPIIGLTEITPKNFPWDYLNDMVAFGGVIPNFIARVIMVTCLLIMLWAVATLGFKCSNLTNRGIVTEGPYRFIRHPHYAFKLAHWWITLLPVFISVPLAPVFMAGWTGIYFLRAITEERHLRSDPDYVAYCEKVKYRFIPGVY
jgi:protein-S-isoprenylcysteine O-methyltransferase Ste14